MGKSESVDAIVGKMPKIALYAIFWTSKVDDLSPVIAEHLAYIRGIEDAGKLFLSGPLDTRKGPNGMTILRVRTRKEAQAIAAAEPFVKAGLRDYTIERWFIHEGALSISVSLSHGTAVVS